MEIKFGEVGEDLWLRIEEEGVPVYKVRLAWVFRDYLKPEYEIDKARDDGFNTEQAFKKLALGRVLEKELQSA